MSTTPIPIDQFAAAIRAKHPGAYDNRTDAELVNAYVNKYPVYKDRVAGFAETNFEKEKSDAAPDRGAISGIGSALSSLNPFSGSNSYTDAVSGIAKMLFNPASAGTDTAKQAIQRTVSAANDPALKNLPVTKAIYTAGSALSPFVPGLNPESMSERASRADTSGIYGEAAIPTTLALAPYLKKGASSARSAISNAAYTDGAVNPKLAAIGDAIEHPTTIPGKLVKGTASALFPPPEPAPVYPGAMLPSLEDFYANRGAEINAANKQMAQAAKAQAKIPNWEQPAHDVLELGSPEYPGPFSKIPNRVPTSRRGDPFAPSVEQASPNMNPFEPTSSPDDLISRMKKIALPGEQPSAADLKRAGDFTQVSTDKLKVLARFGDKLAQNELNRRLKQ